MLPRKAILIYGPFLFFNSFVLFCWLKRYLNGIGGVTVHCYRVTVHRYRVPRLGCPVGSPLRGAWLDHYHGMSRQDASWLPLRVPGQLTVTTYSLNSLLHGARLVHPFGCLDRCPVGSPLRGSRSIHCYYVASQGAWAVHRCSRVTVMGCPDGLPGWLTVTG